MKQQKERAEGSPRGPVLVKWEIWGLTRTVYVLPRFLEGSQLSPSSQLCLSAPWGTPRFAVWDLQAHGSCFQGHTGGLLCAMLPWHPAQGAHQLWWLRKGLQDTCKSWDHLQGWVTDSGEVRAGQCTAGRAQGCAKAVRIHH